MIILPVRWKASDSRWRQKHYFKCLSYAFLFFWCWLQSSAETRVSRCSLHCRYSSCRIIDFGTDSRYFRVFWHYLRRSCPLEERPHVCVCAAERKVENEGTAGSEAEDVTWNRSIFVSGNKPFSSDMKEKDTRYSPVYHTVLWWGVTEQNNYPEVKIAWVTLAKLMWSQLH